MAELTREELVFLLETLDFRKEKVRSYDYPGSHEEKYRLRQQQLGQIDEIQGKLRRMRDDLG